MAIYLNSEGQRQSFFYVGISYPFRKGPESLPEAAFDEQLVKDSLTQIIRTKPGERVMRPEFGSNFIDYLMENNNSDLEGMFRMEISRVVNRFEPRVLVRNVEITRTDNVIDITIFYALKQTGQPGQVVIPINNSNTIS